MALAAAAHIHILHHLRGKRVSFEDSSQASELLLSHWPELGYVSFPEPIIIVQKNGSSQLVTPFVGEHRIYSTQNNRVENKGVVVS